MSRKKPKKWVPMQRCKMVAHNAPPELQPLVEKFIDADEEIWGNGDYTVFVRRQKPVDQPNLPELVHLSIHDKVRSSRHDWRDLQRIKNEILGPEEEAFEVYPAESRLVDTSNEFHLWSFKGVKMTIGFQERLVSEDGVNVGSKQRKWSADQKPVDLKYIDVEMMNKMTPDKV